jgi:hypothetical protein
VADSASTAVGGVGCNYGVEVGAVIGKRSECVFEEDFGGWDTLKRVWSCLGMLPVGTRVLDTIRLRILASLFDEGPGGSEWAESLGIGRLGEVLIAIRGAQPYLYAAISANESKRGGLLIA